MDKSTKTLKVITIGILNPEPAALFSAIPGGTFAGIQTNKWIYLGINQNNVYANSRQNSKVGKNNGGEIDN